MGNAGLGPDLVCCNNGAGGTDPQNIQECQVSVFGVGTLGSGGRNKGGCVLDGSCLDPDPTEDRSFPMVKANRLYWTGPGPSSDQTRKHWIGADDIDGEDDWAAPPQTQAPARNGFRPMAVCSSDELQGNSENQRIDPWTRFAQTGRPVRAPANYLADTVDGGVIVCDQDPMCAGHIHVSEEVFQHERDLKRGKPRNQDFTREEYQLEQMKLQQHLKEQQQHIQAARNSPEAPSPPPSKPKLLHNTESTALREIFHPDKIDEITATPHQPSSQDATNAVADSDSVVSPGKPQG
mmetsp:Transcript_20096/g.30075  ORF Transcript_20096/g.30075 Transcript_20096/m.30075 type:complete len:293 (+) Transcript_20096:45-923(+)|eukprot:CAMPEP_0206470576 /NCGR_PEP_ID=MMETSP0324_2-20121206/31021_1 /ASSEMBLY_ACC=CAM_ASM_000836 /TAXON_ID=2866 /ORGANISM="Crypthecodinium cohnii, Strain Seligo" /LENGTH=292 /DNA_ID=CAMNT_0053944679 /DNA_START=70 /DNA_END=948 /DNA_ORIENTATION=+